MGAKISNIGSNVLTIEGVDEKLPFKSFCLRCPSSNHDICAVAPTSKKNMSESMLVYEAGFIGLICFEERSP